MPEINKLYITNSKGGVGKSTLSHYVLPFYFYLQNLSKFEDLNLTIVELDATNQTREDNYKDSCIDYKYNKLNRASEIKDIFIDTFFDEESRMIFDNGGGRDSFETISAMLEVETTIDNFLFILPFNLSEDSLKGAIELYKEIVAHTPSANVLLVANKIPYLYNSNGKPYKKYLSDNDVLEELKYSKLDVDFIQKQNIPFSYVPTFKESLNDNLFKNIDGCCLDFCKELIDGVSPNELRKKAKTRIVSMLDSKEEQKQEYAIEVNKIIKKTDLFTMLDYCKPLFEKINSFSVDSKKTKTK